MPRIAKVGTTPTALETTIGYLMTAPIADAQQLLAIGAIIVAQRGSSTQAGATVAAVNNASGQGRAPRRRAPKAAAPVAVPQPAAAEPAMTLAGTVVEPAATASATAPAAPRRRGRPPINRPAAVEPAPLPDQQVDEE